MRKTVALVLVLVFLAASCITATSPVKAQFLGSVYINPDGSVTGTNSIQRDGDVYTLTGNISGGIQVQKSGIVLDGAGYAVEGKGEGRGIDLSNGRGQDPSRPEVSNVTVKNLQIVNFYYGVDNANTNNNTFMGNYIANCVNSYWIIGSSNNNIKYNTLMNATIAINYAGSNHVTKNNFINCWLTVWLSTQPVVDGNYWSDYSTRYPDAKEIGNTGVWDTHYEYGESVVDNHPLTQPVDISQYDNSEDTHIIYIRPDGSIEGTDKIQRDGNTYTFSSDVYGSVIVEKDDLEISGSGFVLHGLGAGGIVLENRNNVMLRNIKVIDATFGITIRNGSNNEITGSNCSILLENSLNNTISGNERISMLFTNASKNIVKDNKITDNALYGFKLQSASNENQIFGNDIVGSVSGIEFHGGSNNNSVYENQITNNTNGMIFYNSFNNSVNDNVIAYNRVGIYLESASSNRFYRNDFVENWEWQATSRFATNFWDNGSVGNYWSNYNGTDTDGDGIGSEPYLIRVYSLSGDRYDADNYPLMKPIQFSEAEPVLTLLVVAVSVVVIALVAIGLLVYFKNRNH